VGDTPQISFRQTEVEDAREKNMGFDNVPRCQHVKVNGTQCGSPALRWRRLCFFHNNVRRERKKNRADETAKRLFELPLLEDANSVQTALMKVIQMLGSGGLDHKTAGLMLYALQTASSNLRRVDFEADEVTNVVIDRDDVYRTSIDGPQWFEEDFEEEEQAEGENDADDETEDEANDEDAVAAAPAQPATVKQEAALARKVPAPVKHITTEEARMKVQGVVRNWLLETVGEQGGSEAG
jgi:hypothetical protein